MGVYHSIKYLVVVIGQACSLKCKNCANFSPYAPKDTREYDYKEIIKDLELLFRHVGVIHKLQIQGGEPFCHPHLGEIIKYILDSKKVDRIVIATNGTIVPKEHLIGLLQDDRVKIRISNYQMALGSEKMEALTGFCNKNNINYRVYDFVSKDSFWYRCGGISDHYDTDMEATEKRFRKCAFKDCLTLENHKLGWCSRSTISPRVQNFQPEKEDYFEVRRKIDFVKEFDTWMQQKRTMQACRYCFGTEGEPVIPGEQL